MFLPPPQVSAKGSVQEQIAEMREWFRAWANQNYTERDYRSYFKPVLCYLEGYWSISDEETIDEPFDSDRHFLSASSWLELAQLIMFKFGSGHKDPAENEAMLPTMIRGLADGIHPELAQWNYQILCHPLADDLPLNRFRAENDLTGRMHYKIGKSVRDYKNTRSARFVLNADDQDWWKKGSSFNPRLLDKLMAQIPGMDGPGDPIEDRAFGDRYKSIFGGTLNARNYHSYYQLKDADANGRKIMERGYNDPNMFMALTNQDKVSSIKASHCYGGTCTTETQKWTYAVPLEVIYLTPLNRWNPYDLEYKGHATEPYGESAEIDSDGNRRTGDNDPLLAYNGTNHRTFYHIPEAFFQSDLEADPADTSRQVVWVLDRQGLPRAVRASGIRIQFPNIPGVGTLRQRYIIAPLSVEGDPIWKELEALKDLFFHPGRFPKVVENCYDEPFEYDPEGIIDLDYSVLDHATMQQGKVEDVCFELAAADEGDGHVHEVHVSGQQLLNIYNGDDSAYFTTSAGGEDGHSHTIQIYRQDRSNGDFLFKVRSCGAEGSSCPGHMIKLLLPY